MSPTENKPAMAGSEQPGERVWPVATVMATGIFTTTFLQLQGLGYVPFNHLLTKTMGFDSSQAATFMALGTLPWSFKAIAGLFIDGVPLFGSRRRAYLLLSGLAASTTWAAIAFAPRNYYGLLALIICMNAAIVFGSAAAGGLMVEAGQKFGASGRLSSLRVFMQTFGNGFGLWVGGLLAGCALGWTSMVAILPLICMFCVTWLLQHDKAPAMPQVAANIPVGMQSNVFSSIWLQIRNVVRIEMLLPAVLLFFLQAVPTFRSTSFYVYQTDTLHYTDTAFGSLQSVGCAVSLLSTGVYAWWCRRVPLRMSLYLAILMTALSALPYLFYASYPEHMMRAVVIESVGTFLVYGAYLPLFDLMVRVSPKGSEALGFALLVSVWNLGLMLGTKTGPALYEGVLHRNMGSLIWLNASVTLLGALFVFWLPKTLVERREGK